MEEFIREMLLGILDVLKTLYNYLYEFLFWFAAKLGDFLLFIGIFEDEGTAYTISFFIVMLIPVFILGKIFGWNHLRGNSGGN
ncbi:hypothetical protein [Virgibacillus ndiopensis]|uniref:hypothetical protein n=1 Tax=Virgibacillus ndiopensis TaxID=2004408 RepID=UPI000C07AB13|nr:hypothetical protein [Virgibacillus ndiopensis]